MILPYPAGSTEVLRENPGRCAPPLQAEGVAGYFDYRDVPGDNHIGAVAHDEEVAAPHTDASLICIVLLITCIS